MNFRGICGLGPRFALIKSNTIRIHLGVIGMYEYEQLTDNNLRKCIRMSNYLSLKINLSKSSYFINTTYYQPLIEKINNTENSKYRISTESSLKMKVNKRFLFSMNFVYCYDNNPPINISKRNYIFTNTINYIF